MLLKAASVASIGLGTFLILRWWATFSEAWDAAADNDPIVYVIVGGVPILLGLSCIAVGAFTLLRRT